MLKLSIRKQRSIVLLTCLAACAPALAGGFVEIDPAFGAESTLITNPWWPLPQGLTQVHLAEEDDECVISVLQVMPYAPPFDKLVNGVQVLTVMDRELIDTEGACDGDLDELADWELLEITLDWFAQDLQENVWYMGEHTIELDYDECDHPTGGIDPILGEEGCLDGSWEAGRDIWEDVADEEVLAGIIMLRHPEKGQFYFQEYWEDEATDMGKILNLKTVDSVLFEEPIEGCLVIKEWVPLEPGNVEHKYYCEDVGLVQVEGNAGGKTVWTDLIFDSRFD